MGKSTAEICLNSLIGVAAGYLLMRFAKSSALIVGVGILAVELVGENSYAVVEHGGTIEKYFKMILESLTLDEVYRRIAARGFVAGMLIGMTLE